MVLIDAGNITKEAGPVSMTFTVPMYNPSRLQVRISILLSNLKAVIDSSYFLFGSPSG